MCHKILYIKGIEMKEKIILFILFIFLFVGCVPTLSNQQINNNDFYKLNKTISIIDRFYLRDIPPLHRNNLNKKYFTKEDINNDIKSVLHKLDKYSVFINTKDKKEILNEIQFKIINEKILYVAIPNFYNNTAKNISQILIENKNNAKALILDLRNNPGGLVSEAVKTVNLFVDKGDIVSVKQKNMNGIRTYRANSQTTITDIPIVVLTNKNTASSAEIVSGALQNLNRATLIGRETFGKNTIQALIYITKDKKEAINLTIARYYFPSKKRINNKIKPDILFFNYSSKKEQLDPQMKYATKYLKSIFKEVY